MSNNSLLSPPDTPAVPSEETINAITSGYDDRLREILLESHTKNAAAAVAAAASVSYNGDAEQEEEYIGLNDETEATYERPRVISQSRSMSSPSIRAVKKRMSVPLHSMAGEATKAAAEQDLKSFMSQYSENKKRMSVEPGTMLEQTLTHGVDATVGDDDPNYVKPSIPKTNRNSIQMVRKRASVLQQAIENPSHSLSKVLADKKEAEELELLHNNEYSAPSKTITPRTASQDSISLLRRGSNPANSGSEAVNLPNEELINAVAEEVSFAGRVDPETVSTADFVVSASGIVKTEHASYKPPQFRKISHSASLPHLQPLPKKESLQQSSSLKTFMEGNSPSKRHSSNPSAASSTAAGSNDMIHPTLSLPRPPKKEH
ncbi:hypothetical protein BCR33DRAFT_184069 [Rhizoclosmatium globosum]|uniref:Uncharacterized protein n=1 Tax=Rhizoclosmatium globosum TaxID=329046 RepID=A0A1Y2D379_9FUNG|nr:hypothetical protein BCR33DRAFT_184069 [Rhizoclosmatium globosum]|eukprot:ORY53005.1 hypothetical protein BCR33DRAFT_184069 [Rhizoclosmatium globosum]